MLRQIMLANGISGVLAFAGVLAYASRVSGQASFTEEALPRGLNYAVAQNTGLGQGVAVADLDRDGDEDVVLLGRSNGAVGIFENVGAGYFADRSAGSGVPLLLSSSGIVAGDYDGDDDPDLYITRISVGNKLLRNDGGFHFTDVTIQAGVGDTGPGEGACFGDYDGDGQLDIYLANYTNGYPNSATAYNRLFHNLGSGTFAEVGAALGVNDPGLSFQGVFFDYDRDGDVDLYLSNDRGSLGAMYGNRLWRNDGGTFTDVSVASGTDGHSFLMGVAVGDFDGNAFPDIYVTNIASFPNVLYMNQANGTFANAAASHAVESFRSGWGAIFFDYDNDGTMELHVCNQSGGRSSRERFYHRPAGGPCIDTAPALQVAGAEGDFSYCSAISDFDGDGDMDLIVQNWDQPILLYINHEGQSRNWLKVRLVGAGRNTYAVGATVDVNSNGVTQMRQVIAGDSYKSTSSPILHFGLNNVTVAQSVTVLWPGGNASTRYNVSANQTIVICEPWLAGDLDGDGAVTSSDITRFVSEVMAPRPLGLCRADMNADGEVNGGDVSGFVASVLP